MSSCPIIQYLYTPFSRSPFFSTFSKVTHIISIFFPPNLLQLKHINLQTYDNQWFQIPPWRWYQSYSYSHPFLLLNSLNNRCCAHCTQTTDISRGCFNMWMGHDTHMSPGHVTHIHIMNQSLFCFRMFGFASESCSQSLLPSQHKNHGQIQATLAILPRCHTTHQCLRSENKM